MLSICSLALFFKLSSNCISCKRKGEKKVKENKYRIFIFLIRESLKISWLDPDMVCRQSVQRQVHLLSFHYVSNRGNLVTSRYSLPLIYGPLVSVCLYIFVFLFVFYWKNVCLYKVFLFFANRKRRSLLLHLSCCLLLALEKKTEKKHHKFVWFCIYGTKITFSCASFVMISKKERKKLEYLHGMKSIT